jgi:hypothetical protein
MTAPTAANSARAELDLVQEELRDIAADIVDRRTADTNTKAGFGVYAIPGTDPAAELGRHIEREVFSEFFGNSPQLLAEEYSAYEENSVFITVLDHRRRLPAGVMRVIMPSATASQKSLDDIERVWKKDPTETLQTAGVDSRSPHVWDVATLAVTGDYRGGATQGLVSLALYQGLAGASLRHEVQWWVAVLDVVVLDLIQKQTTRPFRYFRGVEPLRYLDSPSSVPVWADVPDWERRIAAADPAMHELLCLGSGLEEAVSLPDWSEWPASRASTSGTSAAGTGLEYR